MHMVSGGGGYSSSSSSHSGGGTPMSAGAKAAWKATGLGGLILLPVVVAVVASGAAWTAVLASSVVAMVFAIVALVTTPAAGLSAFFGPALWGAAAGLAIGLLRRAHLVRDPVSGSLVGALFSSRLWYGQSNYPVLEFGIRALIGYCVGLAFAGQAVFGPGRLSIVASLATAAGGGPGGGGDGSLALGYVILWIAAIIIGVVVGMTLTAAMMWLLLERVGMSASQGAISGTAKELMILLSEDWNCNMESRDRRTVLKMAAKRGALKGLFSGAIVGAVLLIGVG